MKHAAAEFVRISIVGGQTNSSNRETQCHRYTRDKKDLKDGSDNPSSSFILHPSAEVAGRKGRINFEGDAAGRVNSWFRYDSACDTGCRARINR
jgi:hypothetical protein